MYYSIYYYYYYIYFNIHTQYILPNIHTIITVFIILIFIHNTIYITNIQYYFPTIPHPSYQYTILFPYPFLTTLLPFPYLQYTYYSSTTNIHYTITSIHSIIINNTF